MASRELSRINDKETFAAWRHPRVTLWATTGIAALGFLATLEFAARHYGLPGPVTNQVKEFIFAPKSGFLLYASMALSMVALTRRQRFISVGAAIGIDAVFLLVRWIADAKLTFGNGALWVIAAHAFIAMTRRTGQERILMLKGVGLALLLVAGRKTGDAWLLITSKTRPAVLDQYVATADHALGNPSWVAGRIVRATGTVGEHLLDYVYIQLAVAAVCIAFYQLRNVATERAFPRHHLVRTFLVIGLLGPGIYMLFPVVGPVFAYGVDGGHWAAANLWPDIPPLISPPRHMPFDEITPRNCMPSLHTAWATAIFIHSRRGPRALRFAGTFWLIATLGATLGFGYHYGADIVAGVVFTLTIEAALRSQARGWDRSGIQTAIHGVAVFVTLLLAYRFLPLQMAEQPWIFGPVVILLMISVIHRYVRTTRSWDPKPPVTTRIPGPRPAPQSELV
ncbi:phosphatase PAP2 family protein [Actinoplanes regularis]|uniref:phosphatase PAP2 family protein n=1 Tax=Actinoplanes regularis TaxID=52697 RepID=UPI0024A0E15B|nr:phosphatase PAP2 family protein [Actinoplanes regularis]GLW34258.1 inositol phosphorylceramide synthase [Actinoplanes regularis]